MRIAFMLVFAAVFSSCNSSSNQTEHSKSPEKTNTINDSATTESPVFSVNNYQQTALFLAGMAQHGASGISDKLLKNEAYLRFCDTMNAGFRHMEVARLGKMRDWAKTELAYE